MGEFLGKVKDFVVSVFDVGGIASILNVKPVYVVLFFCAIVIGLIISISKKAVKLAIVIFIFGFLFAIAGPVFKNVMEDHGISIQDKVLTVETAEKTYTIDMKIVKSFETREEGAKTVITVVDIEGKSQSVTVPTAAARIVTRVMNLCLKIGQAGAKASEKI